MQKGSTLKAIRLTQLQARPKKIEKNSSETFWTDHVLFITTAVKFLNPTRQ
jgi:hypothetical protein